MARPLLCRIEYVDGLVARVLELNGAVGEWSAAWRGGGADGRSGANHATQFWTQEARPAMHFTVLFHGIEDFCRRGEPPWPIERTPLTTGALDALLRSRLEDGRRLETPWLRWGPAQAVHRA